MPPSPVHSHAAIRWYHLSDSLTASSMGESTMSTKFHADSSVSSRRLRNTVRLWSTMAIYPLLLTTHSMSHLGPHNPRVLRMQLLSPRMLPCNLRASLLCNSRASPPCNSRASRLRIHSVSRRRGRHLSCTKRRPRSRLCCSRTHPLPSHPCHTRSQNNPVESE